MKKLLLSLTACLLALPAMAETATYTVKGMTATLNNNSTVTFDASTLSYTNKNYIKSIDCGKDAVVELIPSLGGNTGNSPSYNRDEDLRLYPKNTLTFKAKEGYKISKVEFEMTQNTGSGKSNKYATPTVTPGTWSDSNSQYFWSNTQGVSEFTITANSTTGKQFSFKSFTVTYESNGAPTLNDPEVAFPEKTYTAKLGRDFAAPKASTAVGAPAVAYSSENPAVATVDAATGAVTLVAEGTTIIYAKTEANAEWNAGTASYTLTVEDPNKIFESALGEEFKFTNPEGSTVPWQHDAQYGLKGSAYVNKAAQAADAVAYYEITLGEGGYELNFDEAFNMYKLNNVLIDVAEVVNYAKIVVREKGATEWTTIAGPKAPEAFSWKFFANGPVSLNAYAGKTIEFGFRYISTAEVAGTWEIKNISIKKVEAVAPEAPAILVNGNAPTADTIEVEDGEISFGEVAEGVAIYFNVERSNTTAPDQGAADVPNVGGEITAAPAASVEKDGVKYNLYTTPVKLEDGSSVIRYFARANGLDSEVKTLTVSSTTGIEGVAVEEGAAVWYDLNGVRVAEPKQGLYIRVQGGKATKELRK